MARLRAYINPFNAAGSAYAGWTEVTKHLLANNLGSLSRQLDVSDYDIGVFTTSAMGIELINAGGEYSDVGTGTSIFGFKRADSKFRVTWDPADFDNIAGFARADDMVGGAFTIFEGVLSDESTVMQMRSQKINFDVLGYEALLDRALIDSTWAGSLPADHKASTMIKRALAIAAAASSVAVLTIDNSQIVPSNDVTWDDITVFTNLTVRDAVNMMLTASNSVLYMSGTTPIVSGRTAGASSAKTFYGPGSILGPENIIDLKNVSNGLNRTFNVVTWTTSEDPPAVNLLSQDVTSKGTYGVRKKNVTISGISTTATQQSVIDAIKTEFSTPKQELTLVTTMTPDTVQLALLNRILIDFPSITLDGSPALYEIALYGVAQYPSVISTFVIDTTTPFKIIAISMSPNKNELSLKLRQV